MNLSDDEIDTCEDMSRNGTRYKYFTLGEYIVDFILESAGDVPCRITVPHGFLTNGNSGGPDYGVSWVFHDYLYSWHMVVNTETGEEIDCTRKEADEVMSAILDIESESDKAFGCFANLFEWGFAKAVGCNVFGLFSRAWKKSGARGPEFVAVTV